MHGSRSDKRGDSLEYLQSMLGQMRAMAEAEKLDMLAYLIEMAYVEASDLVRGQSSSRVREDKRDSAA